MSFLKSLFGGKAKKEKEILDKILVLDDEEKYQDIIDIVDNLEQKEKTSNLLSEQARAYNNLSWELEYDENGGHLKHLKKAVEIFKSIEKEQSKNPIWNYRIGYSYFFLDDLENAKKHLMKGDKERGADLIEVVEYAEEHSIPLEAAKANFMNERHLYTPEEMESLENYIENNFGKIGNVFHEIISPDIHCDIYVVEPTEERNYYTLITGGMGAYNMQIPDNFNSPSNAELIINVPADWDIQNHNDEKSYWPFRWLKILARLPIEQETFLGWGHTIPTGEPLEGTDFKGMFLIAADDNDNEEGAVAKLPSGKDVHFYYIVPLYEQEMMFKLENDAGELLDKFGNANISYPPVVDVNRINVSETFMPTQNDGLLDDVCWEFKEEIYPGLMPFFEEVKVYNNKINNDLEEFTPFATMFQSKKVKVMYDALVKGKEDLYEYEIVTDNKYFEKELDSGGYLVKIVATFESSSSNTFGALEILFLVNNTIANKRLGEHNLFEGFELIGEEEDGTPLLHLLLKS